MVMPSIVTTNEQRFTESENFYRYLCLRYYLKMLNRIARHLLHYHKRHLA